LERFDYREAGPQLLLQAFLQRIINGGGRVDREYGLGRSRTDLLIVWPYPAACAAGGDRTQTAATATWRRPSPPVCEQTWAYADASGADEAHLVIFDRTPGKPWTEKIWQRQERYRGLEIAVWGC
jgi:hypothetical protein